jgi:hypothetical protein
MKGQHEDRKLTKPKGKDYSKYHKKMVDVVDEEHKELEEKPVNELEAEPVSEPEPEPEPVVEKPKKKKTKKSKSA